jgi:hypothetical protein
MSITEGVKTPKVQKELKSLQGENVFMGSARQQARRCRAFRR